MNEKYIRTAARAWIHNNRGTVETAKQQLSLYISHGVTSAMPFNYFALLVECVLGEDHPNRTQAARIVWDELDKANTDTTGGES